MPSPSPIFVGIDVGGLRKGFHAVAMQGRAILESRHSHEVEALVQWVRHFNPAAIAIDAPCAWSSDGRSRQAERELQVCGSKIPCFSTPTQAIAGDRSFYGWVHHGLKLYQALGCHFPLYRGTRDHRAMMLETFPHAVCCALAGQRIAARPKARTRRALLKQLDIDDQKLPNIDSVDAALCAIAAKSWADARHEEFGNSAEGFIVIPKLEISSSSF